MYQGCPYTSTPTLQMPYNSPEVTMRLEILWRAGHPERHGEISCNKIVSCFLLLHINRKFPPETCAPRKAKKDRQNQM